VLPDIFFSLVFIEIENTNVRVGFDGIWHLTLAIKWYSLSCEKLAVRETFRNYEAKNPFREAKQKIFISNKAKFSIVMFANITQLVVPGAGVAVAAVVATAAAASTKDYEIKPQTRGPSE